MSATRSNIVAADTIGGDGRARLAKLFGRLGSEHAGERGNALDAIERALAAGGLSWAWVCDVVARGVGDAEAAARDRLLTRLMRERVDEAMVGAYTLANDEHGALRKVSLELKEVRSLAGVKSAEILRALDLADLVRCRVGRRW